MTTVARRVPSLGALVVTFALVVGAGLGIGARSAAAAEQTATPWTGSVDLYREGAFTTQKTLLWCTAASIQILRNIVSDEDDHTRRAQQRYFEWMRERNGYDLPLSAGIDPRGWTAGMRQFVDDRYRLVASDTFDEALASAVTNLRATNLPVAITVARGNHAWLLTGFSATADPLDEPDFRVTSVRVTGPLYGRQSVNGYDMPPDTSLTPKQLRGFFTAWWYAPRRMVWDGRFVSIQPVPVKPASVAAPAPSASAVPATPVPRVRIATGPVPSEPVTTEPPQTAVRPTPRIALPGPVAPGSTEDPATVVMGPGGSLLLALAGILGLTGLVAAGIRLVRAPRQPGGGPGRWRSPRR